jgi:hypothetical protein
MIIKALEGNRLIFNGNFSKLDKHINNFLLKNDYGIVISFVDEIPVAFENNKRCVMWRSVFDYSQDYEINKEAYKELDNMRSVSSNILREIFDVFYHDYAVIIFKIKVYRKCQNDLGLPVLFILPPFIGNRNSNIEKELTLNQSTLLDRPIQVLFTPLLFVFILLYKRLKRFGQVFVYRVKHYLWHFPINLLMVIYKKLKRFGQVFVYRTSTLLKGVYFLLTRKRRLLEKISKDFKDIENAVVMTLEDSGTMVNLNPAIEIINKIDKKSRFLVLTSSDLVEKKIISRCNATVINITTTDIAKNNVLPVSSFVNFSRIFKSQKNINLDVLSFLSEVNNRYGYYYNFIYKCDKILKNLSSCIDIKVIFSIYEVLPIAIAAGKWANKNDIPWLGFFPILSGDRPDGYYFPADRHLVYGDQLADIIFRSKKAADVMIVGSPTYDIFFRRDKDRDMVYIESAFSNKGNRKLVVVATEAFADPLIELNPILSYLSKMSNVFIVIKVHPKDSVNYFKSIANKIDENIVVLGQCDLGALLNAADLLICTISNIIISAAIMGTPTLSCDFSGKRKVLNFVEEGLCYGCDKIEEIPLMVNMLLLDGKESDDVQEKIKNGMFRFNGPNDGESAARIGKILLEYF